VGVSRRGERWERASYSRYVPTASADRRVLRKWERELDDAFQRHIQED
jgi:hypothetical protein